MTWTNRFRLLGGLVVVLAVVAAATFQLNNARGRVESSTAQIAAESYVVGTPYAGLVVEQLAQVGDAVTEGQPLFLIDSANLQRDLSQGAVPPRTVQSDIDAQGYLTVRATGDGTVTALEGEVGTFVQESTALAEIQRAGSLHVSAEYVLTSQQYARLAEDAGATIVLPDGAQLAGAVSEVSVEDQDGQALVVVSVQSDELLAAEPEDRLVAAGTPVVTRLHLENDGLVSDIAASLEGYWSTALDSVTGVVQADDA